MARPKATIDPAKLVSAFAATGLHGTSSDQLAEHVGVAKPTLYAHGHTKQTLFLLAVETEVERLLDRLHRAERLTRGRSARDRTAAAAHAILNHGVARPDGLRLLAHVTADQRAMPADPATATVARIPDRIAGALKRDLISDGLDGTLAPALARAVWGAAIALATAPGRDRRLSRPAATLAPPRPMAPSNVA